MSESLANASGHHTPKSSELQRPSLAITLPSSTNATIEKRASDSMLAYDSTKSFGDALARATSIDLADEYFDAPDDCGAF